MAPSKPKVNKKIEPSPLAPPVTQKEKGHPLFESCPKKFTIGGNIRPKTDLGRYVKWPRYITLQRQRRVLLKRLKVPPAINQFSYALDRNQANQLFRLLNKYRPETRLEKKARLAEEAKFLAENPGSKPQNKKPFMLKYGLNHVTDLIELKKAKLVVIAHDVEPIELVCWLPALCRKKGVPYCIVKSKSKLGQLVHKKTASCVVVDNIRNEDHSQFSTLVQLFTSQFNENTDVRRRWGGGALGIKSTHVREQQQKILAREQAKKTGAKL